MAASREEDACDSVLRDSVPRDSVPRDSVPRGSAPCDPHLRIALLAAGVSSRLGQAKQLVPIDGVPLIQHAVDQAAPLVETVWVALGMHGDRFWQALREHQRVRRIQVMDSPPKLSASLRAVATAALADPGAQRLVVMLVDQFRVDTNWLRHMLQLARAHPEKVVASCYEGVRGVPALFPRVALEVLTSLKGDHGARAWLR